MLPAGCLSPVCDHPAACLLLRKQILFQDELLLPANGIAAGAADGACVQVFLVPQG